VRHHHQRTIDGTSWTVNEFSATEGLRLLTRLTAICGGPLARAFEALPKDGSILDARVDFALLGTAVNELAGRLDEHEVVELVRRMLACTTADGKDASAQFDLVFQGRYLTLFKVLAFVLEVNFRLPLTDWLQAASQTAVTAGAQTASA
jgi:hypothetical protein